MNIATKKYLNKHLKSGICAYLFCLFFMMFALTGCGGSSGGDNTSSNTDTNNSNNNQTDNTDTNNPNDNQTDNAATITWKPAGGNATITVKNTSRAFMQFAPSIDPSHLAGVSQGRELFVAEWTPAPNIRPLLDGLGPLFNANACDVCHKANGRVSGFAVNGNTTPAILFRLGNKEGQAHPVLGEQLQTATISGLAEGAVTWIKQSSGKVDFTATLANNIQLAPYHMGARISPQLIGMGLLQSVPTVQLLEYADKKDTNKDGISGRPHWVVEEGKTQLGRFGWKAINASLRTQNATAMHQDMGLTTSIHPNGNCTASQTICTTMPNGGSPEVSDASLSAVVDFMSALAVPNRRISNQKEFNQGAKLFEDVGCASCHRPTLVTGKNARFPSLSNQTIYPYTDLLLHDMGSDLDDNVKEKNAESYEWRTPPLWGIGLVAAQEDAHFLHDGRAKTLDEAIRWHGGEAEKVKKNYVALSEKDKKSLLIFLRGL